VAYQTIVVDEPAEYVRRITLNRPEKRNAISTPMRVELLDALRAHDYDAGVRVTVIRGAGTCFSAGYDLGSGAMMDGAPFYSAPGDGQWARQCNDTWFSIWDLAKPVIAQIHGYAIAGATELASACDLVYIAEDAEVSYPVVRIMSPPDWQYHTVLLGLRRAMELMLTGDPISWPGCRATCPRSTSAACTGRSTSGGPGPPSGPGRNCRRWPATPPRRRPIATACWST
jgi:enoyl-CoA hydratase